MNAGSAKKALPLITIGVCVRNCASTISETIESIMIQDYPHELIEVIFVDDGSEDKTLSIIKNYALKMNMKVRVFNHKWRGLGFSRNVVVNNASGKYIVWVDGDMILPKDHIRKQVEFMQKNPNVGIGKAKYSITNDNNCVAFLESTPYILSDLQNESLSIKLPGTGGSIYRTKAIRKVGGFDEYLSGVGEDQDAAFRIKESGWDIKRTSASFVERREQTWKDLWRKYFWYGYGNYKLYQKNMKIINPVKMTPIAGFITGIFLLADSYRHYRRCSNRHILLLLPVHFAFKMTAWCIGFTMGCINCKNGA
ncbi:MAG: glycosyltransferase [Candidatus Baldrarchaeia archaeon]